jgi:cell division septation protein DedD
MRRTNVLLLTILVPLALVAGCSASEESEMYGEEPNEEFTTVDESKEPMLPEEQYDEEPTVPEKPARRVEVRKEKLPEAVKEEPVIIAKPKEEPPVATPTSELPRITPQKPVQPAASGIMMWSVQIGAFKEEQGAVKLLKEAKTQVKQPVYKDYDPVTGFYKVTVGSFSNQEQASSYKQEIRTNGFPDAFTVEVRR